MLTVRFLNLVASFMLVLVTPTYSTENNGDIQQNYPEAQAVLGSAANLPCEVPARPPSSGIKCIFWYKDDEVMSVYTVDARGGEEDVAGASLHVPSDRLRSRARFDPSPWPPVLRLGAVKETDEGVYYCRVDYRWDRTYMYTVVLRVIVPPQKLSILTDHEEQVLGMAGPYLEGQSVTLTCEALGGKPDPVLTWWRGEEQLPSVQSTTSHGLVSNDYTFIPSRSDLLTTLTCQAINNNLTLPSTVSVQIDLYLKPLNVRLTPRRVSLTAGRRIDIRCESSGSRPPARMSWFVNSEPLANHTDLLSIDRNQTKSTLAFWPSRSDHGKQLRCRTENFLLSNSSLEDGWPLNITYAPQVTLTLQSSGQRQQDFLEGDNARFNCEVRSNPEAYDVGWLFEDTILEPDADSEMVFSFRSLLIRKVNRKHSGMYQCYASNSEGTVKSRKIPLNVKYAPVCKSDQKTTYVIPEGTLQQIECNVEADPNSVEFTWMFINLVDRYRHDNVSFIGSHLLSIANYKPMSPRDYGTLYCYGKNSVGEQQASCIFTIIPVGPSETQLNCSATNVTTTSLSIVCVVRFPNQNIRYDLDLYEHESKVLVTLQKMSYPNFEVHNLTSGTEFKFNVYAVNKVGRSAPKTVIVSTMRLPMEEKIFGRNSGDGDATTPRWLGAALIVGAALCCLLLFTTAALWTTFKGGPGCQKCKELPKKFTFTSFSNQTKTSNKNYIDRMPEGYEKRAPCI